MPTPAQRYRGAVRWDALFDDLESQVAGEERGQRESELAERIRAERSTISLVDRLRVQRGPVALHLSDGTDVRGSVADCGSDFLRLGGGAGSGQAGDVVVPLRSVVAVAGVGQGVAAPMSVVVRRLSVMSVLRGLARDRVEVRIGLPRRELVGTIDAVGADHVDLAVHPSGEPRLRALVSGRLTVATHGVVWLRTT